MKNKKLTQQHMAAFQQFLLEDEKSQATIEKYMRDLRCFATYVDGRVVDKALVLAYKAYLGEQYALRSANSMLAAVNSFLRFMGWADLCVRQFKLQTETYCSADKELTKEEYMALVRTAESKGDHRLALVLQTICGTGIRVSELQHVTIEAVRCGEALVNCKGKSRKVFIVAALRKKLLQYGRKVGIHTGCLFVTATGRPLNRSNIWRQMKALCRLAGIAPGKVFPHNLRHLFARTFYRLEKDIAKLADILGHANVNTTRVYIITTGAEHQRCMETMRLIL